MEGSQQGIHTDTKVSKAMGEYDSATAAGDTQRQGLSMRKIQLFTDQLEESNPILTAISDSMTAGTV